jgi:hypothetical protein
VAWSFAHAYTTSHHQVVTLPITIAMRSLVYSCACLDNVSCADEKSYTDPIRLMDQTSKGCTVTSFSCHGNTSVWWCRNLTGISIDLSTSVGRSWDSVIAQHNYSTELLILMSSIEEMIHMKTNIWRRKVDHSPTYIWHSNIKKWVMVQACLSETYLPWTFTMQTHTISDTRCIPGVFVDM